MSDNNFERVQEFQNGLAGDEAGRPFLDVIEDHMLLYSHVCTYCKDSKPYTAFHRMLRSLSWYALEQLDQLKKFLIEMKESEPKHYTLQVGDTCDVPSGHRIAVTELGIEVQ